MNFSPRDSNPLISRDLASIFFIVTCTKMSSPENRRIYRFCDRIECFPLQQRVLF